MTARGVAYIVAAVLLAVFLAANWTLFATPVELNLLAMRIQTPLLIVVLSIVAVIALISLIIQASGRRAWTRERRALKSEIEASHVRVENAEESRVANMRVSVERELAAVRAQLAQLLDGQAALLGRPSSNHVVDPRLVDSPSPVEARPLGARSVESRPIVSRLADSPPVESPVDPRSAEDHVLAPDLIPPRTARR